MNTKLIFLVMVLLFSTNLMGQSAFDKFEDNEDVNSVVISEKMFQMISKINSGTPESKDFAENISKLTGMKVFTTQNTKVAELMEVEVQDYLKKRGLSEFTQTKEKESHAKIYVKLANNTKIASELLIFSENTTPQGTQTVIGILFGEIELDKIELLTKNLNFSQEVQNTMQ